VEGKGYSILDSNYEKMDDILIGLGIFSISIVLHEFGHWLYDYIYTKKIPSIKPLYFFKYLPVGVQIPFDREFYTIGHSIMNHIVGIESGLIFLLYYYPEPTLLASYILLSSLDIISIIVLLYSILSDSFGKTYNLQTKLSELGCDRCYMFSNGELEAFRVG